MGEAANDDDFAHLDDQAFLAERRRVREALEHAAEHGPEHCAGEHGVPGRCAPERGASPELKAHYARLNEEFLRRASIAWAQATQELKEQANQGKDNAR